MQNEIELIGNQPNLSTLLEKSMLSSVPSVENDHVVIYCRVPGKDHNDRLRGIDKLVNVYPQKVEIKY